MIYKRNNLFETIDIKKVIDVITKLKEKIDSMEK